MAVRPIDANAMLNELRPVNFEAEHSAVLLSMEEEKNAKT